MEDWRNTRHDDDLGREDSAPYILVAALDLGTTYSGYAFSTIDKQSEIRLYTKWGEEEGIPHSYKTPTCILTDDDGEFIDLGFGAKAEYQALSPDDVASHRFYESFKMNLYTKKVISLYLIQIASDPASKQVRSTANDFVPDHISSVRG